MAATKKTDNHFTADKIALRIGMLPDKEVVRVLDVFGGRGVIWRGIKRKTGRDIRVTSIDKRDDISTMHLHGDNAKVIKGLDLSRFDVIDLDAYGIPADQLKTVFDSKFVGPVFVTAIQTMNGGMPKLILDSIGLPKETPTSLSAKYGFHHLLTWIGMHGVKKIRCRSWHRKHYFGFVINDAA